MTEHRRETVAIQIDMTPDGEFIAPPSSPFSSKILRVALVVMTLAAAAGIAFLALWLALVLIPIAIGAGLIAYGVLRYRMWKAGNSGGFQGFTFRR
jgi:hypothetical protein